MASSQTPLSLVTGAFAIRPAQPDRRIEAEQGAFLKGDSADEEILRHTIGEHCELVTQPHADGNTQPCIGNPLNLGQVAAGIIIGVGDVTLVPSEDFSPDGIALGTIVTIAVHDLARWLAPAESNTTPTGAS